MELSFLGSEVKLSMGNLGEHKRELWQHQHSRVLREPQLPEPSRPFLGLHSNPLPCVRAPAEEAVLTTHCLAEDPADLVSALVLNLWVTDSASLLQDV